MPTESRAAFLLVRRYADLEGDSTGLTAYLRDLRRTQHASDRDALQGIWIDQDDVTNLPGVLVLSDAAGGRRTVRVTEATGINGVWMLCWLETAAGSVARVDLLAALLKCFGDGDDDASATLSARFVPVFAGDASDSIGSAELQALGARYPELVLAPISHGGSGRLVPLSGQQHRNRTSTRRVPSWTG